MQNPRLRAVLEGLLRPAVVPVLTIDSVDAALPLARALASGGLTTLEITLRTPAALSAIGIIASGLGTVSVGVGTVRSPEQAEAAIAAGARFVVSPGMTPRLLEAAQSWTVPFLPGATTPSEAMALADLGYAIQKFFPAEQSGGISALKAMGAPLSDIRFCPTGGIDAGNAGDYLALENVICVGGSWVAPKLLVDAEDWGAVAALARDASEVAGRSG